MDPQVIDVSLAAAFIAGLISFLSPCVLPLIPGYMSLITKLSFEEISENSKSKISSVLIPSISFILGFTFIFVVLGASASYIGNFLRDNKQLLLQISGVLIIIFGIFVMEIINIPQLNREKRFSLKDNNFSLLGIFLLGSAFAFGWTPCVGPILATILLFASTSEETGKAALLLFTYSMGLGLPFILTGLAFNKALNTFKHIKNYYKYYKFIVGGILILLGIMMLTNKIFYINIYGQKVLDLVGIDFWKNF